MAEFDPFEELRSFVGGEAILNKFGVIEKVRNGVTRARIILGTKQSGVKHITGKFQRVMLPMLFGAVLRMLLLLPQITSTTDAISAFVFDYKEAFWQVPIRPDERQYFCTTAKLRGKRRWLAYLGAAQDSVNAPLLWARLAAFII